MVGIITNETNKIKDGIQNKLLGKDDNVIQLSFIPKTLVIKNDKTNTENNDITKTFNVTIKYLILFFTILPFIIQNPSFQNV